MFFGSDNSLTDVEIKLEHQKFAILVTIADMCWVKNKANARYQMI